MGVENSKLRASSLRLLKTVSGRKQSSKFSSSDNLSRSDRKKTGSSRQTSNNKPKSDTVRSKTKWPYPHVEKDFLPVYNMKAENQKEFSVVNVIASGAYGSVLRGLENKNKRDVAIKVIDKSRVLGEGQGAIQQCKDEVLIHSELPHNDYIVQLVSFWQTRNRLYLVLEYIPNGELFDFWKSLRIFSEDLAKFYLSEIAMAIDFLHRNSVVYRDLKMENILLDSDAHIKIIDFGLSKQLRDGERTRTTCGTLQYTAPEVLKGEPYEKSIDWWSMGVLGYALLNGKFPVFGAKNHVEMRTMVANHQYRMPIHLSMDAADLLTMLLQKNVSLRIKGLDDLINTGFFQGCLSYSGPRLDLKRFLTKADLDKMPDTYHLKGHFEMVYNDCRHASNVTVAQINDNDDAIWKMTSGRVNGCEGRLEGSLCDDIGDSAMKRDYITSKRDYLIGDRYARRTPSPRTISSHMSPSDRAQYCYPRCSDAPQQHTKRTLPLTADIGPRAMNI